MKHCCLGLILLASLLIVSGCSTPPQAPFRPPYALLYSKIEAPLDIDYSDTDTANLKRGDAVAYNILGLFSWGDCSTQAAATQGGLTTIEFADYSYFSILGVYGKVTLHVYGE